MDLEQLLTTTRSARKSLDLDAPVELGIPATYTQGCLLPVGRLRRGQTFRPAQRRPIEEVVAVDSWDGPAL